eukprot:COSAG02_NODE_16666_length_1065_cov_37.078179_2_plen_81_part_00
MDTTIIPLFLHSPRSVLLRVARVLSVPYTSPPCLAHTEKVRRGVAPGIRPYARCHVAHTMHYCGGDECDSDEDGPNTMYS